MMNAISGQEHAGFSCADMLRGVLVIATVDASGRFHPFTGSAIDALERKLKAAREARERIHTVALAEGQQGFAPGQPGDDGHGWPFAIVHACDFDDLTRQLVRQGGLLGQRLRQHARDATLELLLFGKRSARWDDLFQEPRLKKLELRKRDKEEHASRDGHVDAAVGWMRHENITLAETDTQTLPELLRLARSSHSPLRGVIIGPPGAGKSTLLRYAARLLADDAEAERLPLLIHLPRWHSEADGRDWRAALLQHACNMLEIPPQGGEARALRQMLKAGRLLVLLDGLDEVNASFIETHVLPLVEHLDTTGASWLATCRTAARQHWEGLTGPLQADAELRAPLWRLDELDANARERYITHWPWQHKERERRQQALQEAIRTSPQVADLARNPQLLSLLCYVADTVPELPLPPTRVEIFEHAVAHALNASLPARLGVEGAEDATPEDRLALLGEITLQLALHEGRPMEFSWQTIIRCVKVLRKEAGSNADLEFRLPACLLSRQGLERFLDELVERGLLLRHQTARETRFAFLHLSLQEFLTARALALRIDDAGLEQELKADSETKLLGAWLRCWHGEERWRETLLMLAGCLQDPKPLLELFADPARDTLFRDHLATAGLMTAEISALQYEQDDALRRQASRILDDVRDIWLMAPEVVREILDAAISVAFKRPERHTPDEAFIGVLPDMLKNEDSNVRRTALEALEKFDPAILVDFAEEYILPMLRDKDLGVRAAAIEALTKLDPSVLTIFTEDYLLPLLRNKDWWVRRTVLKALQKLDPFMIARISTEHILPLLQDEDILVRNVALDVLSKLDSSILSGIFKDNVLLLLRDNLVWGVIDSISIFLGNINPSVSIDIVVENIIPLLWDEESVVRDAAFNILKRIPHVVADIIEEGILPLLHGEDREIRHIALAVLGKLDSAMLAGVAKEYILPLLHDEDREIRHTALAVLGKLDSAMLAGVAKEYILPLLHDEDREIRHTALAVLARLDSAIANTAKEYILHLLHHEKHWVRDTVHKALAMLDPAELANIVRNHILPSLQSQNWEERYNALITLDDLKYKVPMVNIIGNIPLSLLEDENILIRHTTFELLCELDTTLLYNIAKENKFVFLDSELLMISTGALEVLRNIVFYDPAFILPDIVALMAEVSRNMEYIIEQIYNYRIPIDHFWPPVAKALRDGAPERRIAIMKGLATLGLAADRPPITTMLEELARDDGEDAYVRQAAQEALAKIRRRPEIPAA